MLWLDEEFELDEVDCVESLDLVLQLDVEKEDCDDVENGVIVDVDSELELERLIRYPYCTTL